MAKTKPQRSSGKDEFDPDRVPLLIVFKAIGGLIILYGLVQFVKWAWYR